MNEDGEIEHEGEGGVDWRLVRLKSMGGPEAYEMLALRQRVFMLEQGMDVLDADGRDHEALHLLGRIGGVLVAYARIFVPEDEEGFVKIGRVVVAESARGQGVGRELMEQALTCADDMAPGAAVNMSIQVHLTAFYESLGFVAQGDVYDIHGVPHVDMVRQAPDGEAISPA
jgi:ElaA protein